MEAWLDKFISDPDWERLEQWIAEFFEHETDISTIDSSRSSEAVHAEIIARQRISNDIALFRNQAAALRNKKTQKKSTFR